MKQIFIIPRKGLKVKCPLLNRAIPETGKLVDENIFWKRRLLDGDVSIKKELKQEKKKPTKKQEK